MSNRDCHSRGEVRARWTPRPDGLEESVQFVPGYNCTKPGLHGHGVHSMEVRWLLRGPAGAVWLAMSTGWTPGDLYPGHGLPPSGLVADMPEWPSGCGLGYHALWPQYEEQVLDREDCDVIGAPCYGDMSFSGADEPVRRFIAEGEQVIWDALEARYANLKTGPRS